MTQKSNARVALLTNCVPGYRAPLLKALQKTVRQLRIFVTVRAVPGRDWHLFHDSLDIVVNRTVVRRRIFQNVHGFTDESFIDIPYDVPWVLAKYRPDAIVTSEFGSRTLFCCLYKAFAPKTKLILWATLSERTESTRGRAKEALRRWILARVDGIFVNGRSGERYVRSLGFAGKPLAYINQTVDNAAFLGPATRPVRKHVELFFAGQIVPRKGLYPFLVQLARWCEAHTERLVEVRIVGEGPELDRLRAFRPPPSLTLHFPGTASSSQLPELYRAADLSIFPTLADEWGVVVNEALIAGLPILASLHSQAVEELVQDGVNGWLFDPEDPEQVFHAIDRALTAPPAQLDRMREAAIASVAPLTPDIIAERMLTMVRELHGS